MGKNILFTVLAAFLAVFFVSVIQTTAQKGIKERMRARLPEILELKARGIVGETYGGFLACLGGQRPLEDLVQAENRDRRLVYETIARQQGVTAEFVGKRRAQRIADQAKPGFWLQDENGNWYQKQ